MTTTGTRTAPFDALASEYDTAFTRTLLGRLLRDAVHEELRAAFTAGSSILDLGCGTGEDAIRLAMRGVDVHGIDASPGMVEAARRKAAGHADAARRDAADPPGFRRRDRADGVVAVRRKAAGAACGRIPAPADVFRPSFSVVELNVDPLPEGPYDGAFANFGVLNCIHDPPRLAARLADVLRPHAQVVFVVMGRYCPWEWLWYGARGRVRTALRRIVSTGSFRGAQLRYPTPSGTAADFAGHFRLRRVAGIGVLLPPTFASDFVERHARFASRLAEMERRIRRLPPAQILNDHFLIVLERD